MTVTASGVTAQEESSPITILVNAASSVDYSARLVADQLREALARPVVVQPKLGAGGRIAVAELVRAAPDGRTLLFSPSSPFTIYPNIYKKLDYDPASDVSFIGNLSWFEVSIATSLQSGLADMNQLLAWAKSKGKDALYGVAPGTGSSSHFVGIATSLAAGVSMSPVPYAASHAAIVDLVAGRLPMLITGTSPLVEMHKAGKIKIIAVSGQLRSALIPEVPTLLESGINVAIQNSAGLYGPPKLPRALIERLYAAMLPMVSKSDVRAKMTGQGMTPAALPGPELASWLAAERARFEGLARAIGYEKEDA